MGGIYSAVAMSFYVLLIMMGMYCLVSLVIGVFQNGFDQINQDNLRDNHIRSRLGMIAVFAALMEFNGRSINSGAALEWSPGLTSGGLGLVGWGYRVVAVRSGAVMRRGNSEGIPEAGHGDGGQTAHQKSQV